MNTLLAFASSMPFVFRGSHKPLYLSKISSNENFVCTSLLKRDKRAKLQKEWKENEMQQVIGTKKGAD